MDSGEWGSLSQKNSTEACGQMRVIVIDEQKIIPSLGRKKSYDAIMTAAAAVGKRPICALWLVAEW